MGVFKCLSLSASVCVSSECSLFLDSCVSDAPIVRKGVVFCIFELRLSGSSECVAGNVLILDGIECY